MSGHREERYVCIHGHFYQPPRESPWLEKVEVQDSAHPYHDWNERVTAECYAPNTAARILEEGRITRIVDNYSRISFNFGPTLMAWLEHAEPELYAVVIEADRQSRERYSGHGSALAQAHSHLILPLANERDKRTQVLWGRRDFEHRFGREPEGMWLPETAADTATLEALAEAGIRFTILAPNQARRVRPLDANGDEAAWLDVSGSDVDPSMPYLCRLPSGAEIVLFFYDGPISRGVAFEQLLVDGHRFASRLLSGFDEDRDGAQLVHIATDGETYGHHHRHGEMALAWALSYLEELPGVRLTNYGEFLELRPPTHEVDIHENSSWSCAHGVERWRSDCGCHTGGEPHWHQRWREPLRQTLDWLRDELVARFTPEAERLFQDPWAARDAYMEVLLDRSPENTSAWLARHGRGELDESSRVRAWTWLEMQRHAMYMTTSCGWFFNELSGIETVQVLLYAARALQLAAWLDPQAAELEDEMLRRLEKAPSNQPRFGNGRGVWEALVRPLDLEQIAAHFAVGSLFDQFGEEGKLFCYRFQQRRREEQRTGRAALALGVVDLVSEVTGERQSFTYGVLHFGDHNITGGVRDFRGDQAFEELATEARRAFERVDFTEVVRVLDRQFERLNFSLRSLFADEQRRVMHELFSNTLAEISEQYRVIYEVNAPLMRFVAHHGMPLPEPFRVAARSHLQRALEAAMGEPAAEAARIDSLLAESRALGLELDGEALARELEASTLRLAESLRDEPGDLERLTSLAAAVALSRELPDTPDLWETSNIYFALLDEARPRVEQDHALDEAERTQWLRTFEQIGENLGFRVQVAVEAA